LEGERGFRIGQFTLRLGPGGFPGREPPTPSVAVGAERRRKEHPPIHIDIARFYGLSRPVPLIVPVVSRLHPGYPTHGSFLPRLLKLLRDRARVIPSDRAAVEISERRSRTPDTRYPPDLHPLRMLIPSGVTPCSVVECDQTCVVGGARVPRAGRHNGVAPCEIGRASSALAGFTDAFRPRCGVHKAHDGAKPPGGLGWPCQSSKASSLSRIPPAGDTTRSVEAAGGSSRRSRI
jgi:hypothetical protein